MLCRCMLFWCAVSACVAPMDTDEETSELTAGATTIVSLTFDDTLADQDQISALVEARGMRAVFYINEPRLGTSGYLTRAQAIDLQTRGHEIGGHTLGHVNLPTVSLDEARTQICNDRAQLLAGGFTASTFAYPFGADNVAVQRIAADCGYTAARDVGGLTSPTCPSCPAANPMTPVNLQQVRTYNSIESDATLDTMQQQVINAEQHGGGFVPMVFHHVCDGCASNSVSPALLAQFLDWLATRGPATQVATMQEVIGGVVQPAVRFPDPANLAKNASLENDADANQIPDCWQRGGTGTNTATFSLVADASDGSTAQQIAITAWTSGGRRLVTAQDTGACAPPVTPGKQYSISAFYKATTQPRITVYYRTTAGAWVWFGETPLLPTSATYREAKLTTAAMPADATAISIGLGIFGVGTLTLDEHRVIEGLPQPVLDTITPLFSIACNGTTCSTAPYAAPVRLSLAGSDPSGVAQIRYTTDGSDPLNGTIYSAPFTIPTRALVRATAVDGAGNRTFRSATITINLLQNASLELDANGDQVPDCWKRGGFGTNTPVWTMVSDAYDGTRAQRLEITSFTSGGGRLVSAQEAAGTCAPAATPGKRYTMSGYYKSTVAPKFTVYYRSATGVWTYLGESAAFPVSSTYVKATYTSPVVPAGATAISVGLSIFAVGSLTTDLYTLVEAP